MTVLATILRMGTRRRAVVPTLLVVAVTAAAAAGISAALVVREDAARSVDEAFVAGDGPDLVVTVGNAGAGRVQSMLASDRRIVEVAPPRRIVEARIEHDTDTIPLTVNGIDSAHVAGSLNAPVVTSGRLPSDPGEIALDSAAAHDTGTSPGDTVTIGSRSGDRVFRVVGLAFDLTDCFYPTCDPARAWVPDGVISTLDPDSQVLVAADVTDPVQAEAVGRDVTRALGGGTARYNTWSDTRGDMLAESEFFGAFLAAFGLLALLASAIVITGTVTARTWSRRRALAQMRSIGCTRAQVTGALLVEHALIGIAGVLAGNLGVASIAARLRVGALGVLDDATPGLPLGVVATSAIAVLALCLLATLPPALRAGRGDVVAGLCAAPERTGRGSRLTRLVERLPLAAPLDLGLRSASRRRLRTVLATTAVALAVTTTIVAVSINQTMDDLLAHPELTGNPADAALTPPPGTSYEHTARALDRIPGIAGWYPVADAAAAVGERPVHVRAVGGDPWMTGYVLGEGTPPLRPGQAIAGYGLLEATGWQVGQVLPLDIGGGAIQVTLVGWYRETEDSGELLQIRWEDLQRIDDTAAPYFAVDGTTGTTPPQVGAALTRAFGDGSTVVVNDNDAERLAPFRIALLTMAALVGAVALANMITAAILAGRERSRRTGALRALGMSRRSCFAEAAAFALPSIIAALAIGIPLGMLGASRIGDALTSQLGNGPGLTHGPPPTQLAAILVVVVVAAAVVASGAARTVIARPVPDLLQEPS